MDLDSLEQSAEVKKEPLHLFKRRLNELVRRNTGFRNLNPKNRELIMDLLDDQLERIRDGYGISPKFIYRKKYQLFKDRVKLGLTQEDLDDIENILNSFSKN